MENENTNSAEEKDKKPEQDAPLRVLRTPLRTLLSRQRKLHLIPPRKPLRVSLSSLRRLPAILPNLKHSARRTSA